MPRKPLDLHGQRFGSLSPIRMLDGGGAGIHKRWECLCDCGRTVVVQASMLKIGKATRCVTCAQSLIRPGSVYGKWTVLGYSRVVYTEGRNHYIYWLCQCACGKTREVVASNLLSKKSTKCRSCALTKHGQAGTREYKNHKYREYYEKKRRLDHGWTLEMTLALRKYFSSCVLCGMTSEEHQHKYNQILHVDHVRPLSKKNGLELGNAVILCYSCNTRKGGKSLDDLPPETRNKILLSAESFKVAWENGFR